MTQKDKELLLKDLCARLPYGLKYNFKGIDGCDYTMNTISLIAVDDAFPIDEVKPYLFPLSSMTEKQEKEYYATFEPIVCEDGRKYSVMTLKSDDWLNKNMFDYRGLISMGLALEATEKMYK